ncbi:MAG: hypothetical protein ACP5TY_06160, partial [Thermodesulforhabdaceae bacterium]
YGSEYGGVIVFISNGKRNIVFIVDSVIKGDPLPVRALKVVKKPGVIAVADLDQYKNVDVINIDDLL